MNPTLTADDLWPLVQKLPQDQQVKLARRALQAAAHGAGDAAAYEAMPPSDSEFSGDDAAAGWEAEGWEEFYETR